MSGREEWRKGSDPKKVVRALSRSGSSFVELRWPDAVATTNMRASDASVTTQELATQCDGVFPCLKSYGVSTEQR